jgi:hypothetical protein
MSIRRASTSYLHSLDNSLSFGTQKRKYSNVSAGLGPAQFLISGSTWTKPTNVNYIDIVLVGGGGGGGQNTYAGGGGGGVVTYIKKFYVGNANTWYYQLGFGGDAGGTNSGVGISDTNSWGEAGGPTMFGTNSSVSSFTYSSLNPINDPTILVSPGGGGGGPGGNFGYFAGTGGGSGNGAGSGSWGRLSNDEFWTTGHGFNGGAGSGASGGGGGSSTETGSAGSGNSGGNGASGPDLLAPLPATFVNSASNTITTRFGGGGGGAGASVNGTGGIGGGGNGGSVGTPNTGGGGGGGGNGGSGVIIIWEHTS